jgi:hypothetical protein
MFGGQCFCVTSSTISASECAFPCAVSDSVGPSSISASDTPYSNHSSALVPSSVGPASALLAPFPLPVPESGDAAVFAARDGSRGNVGDADASHPAVHVSSSDGPVGSSDSHEDHPVPSVQGAHTTQTYPSWFLGRRITIASVFRGVRDFTFISHVLCLSLENDL